MSIATIYSSYWAVRFKFQTLQHDQLGHPRGQEEKEGKEEGGRKDGRKEGRKDCSPSEERRLR